MILAIYKRALAVLMKKPIKLWGISLLHIALSVLLTALCGVAIPALGLAVSLLLSTSMLMVYLHGYRGEEVRVLQLFDCFKDWATVKRVVLGLAWMMLWIFLWALIPVVGPIFAIIRTYEYRLTPYILITEPDVPLTEAIKVSAQRTNGYKLTMFGAELLFALGVFVCTYLMGIIFVQFLGDIAVIGGLFQLVYLLAILAIEVLSPLFMGLVQAAFYEEINNAPTAAPETGAVLFCTSCGTRVPDGVSFCPNCGNKL